MTTHWFVYYKVTAADVASCIASASALHDDLRTHHAGLRTQLMRRPGVGLDGCVTLMETFDGLDDDALAEVEARAQAALERFTVGARHCERFVPCA